MEELILMGIVYKVELDLDLVKGSKLLLRKILMFKCNIYVIGSLIWIIKRKKKELGYAVQDLKGDQLNKVITTNVATALSGKIAGVDVSIPATGPGGSTRVIIRGISSIGENNQPLYIVDGVPIDNTGLSNDGAASSKWFDGRDNGDGISSINPNNIESLSVLKGAAASALYGSRALNGVILISDL